MNKKLTIFSWSMYDFANNIFAMNVISVYFALWVTVDKGGEDILYSFALAISMILLLFFLAGLILLKKVPNIIRKS